LFERVEGTTDELRLTKSGVYKIKLRATTHGGIIKSEEAIEVVAINKVADSGLFEFKTLDGKYYDFTSVTGNNSKGAWVNQDVIVCVNKTLKNLEEDIAMGNLLVTYEFSNATTGTNKPETVLNLNNLTTMDGIQNAVEKITDSNTTNFAMKIKIGSITITKNYEINIDKINPESPTISVTSGNEGNSSWYKTDVTLKVTAGKDEGGSDMKDVSYEYTGPITKTNTHISSGGTFTLSTEGTYNIKCYTYDNVGNVSSVATKTIKIDKTAPTITVSPSSATVCKSKSVTITAADTGTSTLNSGNSYQYYLSTSSSALTGGSWTNYTSGSSFTIGNGLTGTYYLYVRQISDVVGNISTTNGTLTTISGTAYHRFGTYVFDNSAPNAPTIEVTSGTVGDNSWYKSNVTLKVTGTDVGTSGVKNVTYQYTGTSTKAATSLTNGSTFTISTDGTYNITCYTYDSLGHVSSATTKTIKIDKTAPTINSFTAANSCNQSIFTGKATDSVSGIVGWQINTSAGTYTSITATTSQITKTNTVTATTTKYFYVKDAAGNVATSSAVKGTVTGSHSYSSKVTKAATCTAAGTRTYTCSVCGTYYTESIPATGHSYSSKVTKAATCTTAGTRTYTCGSCGTYYTQSIAATGHSPGSWQKTSSTHYKKCSTCQAYTSGPSSHGYNTNRCTQVVSGKQCTVYKACGTCGYTRTSHTHSY